ncbi:hypothetical protein C2M04_21570 [Serratia marcescens]|nr:hypothetical protein C2M04_21570 [Serratia marcescens]
MLKAMLESAIAPSQPGPLYHQRQRIKQRIAARRGIRQTNAGVQFIRQYRQAESQCRHQQREHAMQRVSAHKHQGQQRGTQ